MSTKQTGDLSRYFKVKLRGAAASRDVDSRRADDPVGSFTAHSVFLERQPSGLGPFENDRLFTRAQRQDLPSDRVHDQLDWMKESEDVEAKRLFRRNGTYSSDKEP